MDKPATTRYPVHALIKRRWSPRAFAPQAVPTDVMTSLLEAARWAPSCYGEEPWRYLIAARDNPEEFQRLLSGLVEFNQSWAKTAAVLMIGCAKKTFSKNGKPNPHAWHDLGQATAQLTIEANAHGLYVHQMAGIVPDKIRETYGVPADFDIATGIAIGYPGELDVLPADLHAAEKEPRRRRDPSQLFFQKLWGEPADFLKNAATD